MKLTLSSVSICRSPIFSIDEKLENVWQELKMYIHEASPAFFEVIRDDDYAAFKTSALKTRFTVWKYFNRAKFRATPYGNFAAFSLVPVSKTNEASRLILQHKPIVHRFANWQEKENISFDPKWLTHNAVYLRTNTTIYVCDEELRYINIENGAFELSAIMNEEITKAALDFCHDKRKLIEIQAYLNQHGLSKSMCNYLVEQLISFQLLITDFQPNIIGTDYFNRIGHIPEVKKNDYLIAERKRITGHLQEKNLQVLIELTDFLNKNVAVNRNIALDNFRNDFTKRFENKEVPLLTAMDPEIGIGYLSLIQDKEEDPLVQELKTYGNGSATAVSNLNYSALHQFILNQFISQKTVQLDEFKSAATNLSPAVANTISILFHQSDEYMVIEQIGGCTANALLGRFTMASEEITALGQQFADKEQIANPQVIFFDIAYQIEKNADNINRRRSIYNYELPILSWTESKHILDIDDIMISVMGDEVILRSVKYGKRVVPKVASAYNYTRSDLAVYRFLADLQHQNLHSSLGINVLHLLPGLEHYERIQYKTAVLSPEMWLVPNHLCKSNDLDELLIALSHWLQVIKLHRPFKCGFADQTLLFNPAIEDDMRSFLLFCKHKRELYIEEAFIPENALVRDENNKSYLSEFIVNLEHNQQIYHPYQQIEKLERKRSSVFIPGEEWLYFEIYCHPSRSNAVLLDIADSFLPVYRKEIKNWFFIRYNDPANHIRLRLQLKNTADAGTLLSGISKILKPYITTGIVADLQLKTYRQETERYGPERISLVEKCFNADSSFVIGLITRPAKINELYASSIAMMENIWQNAGFTPNEQLLFADNMVNHFSLEMKINSEGFKKLNSGFKEFETNTATLFINKMQQKKALNAEKYFLKVLQTCNDTEKNKMLSDLFHMHTNRLFNADQRMHELIMYYYLSRKLKTKIGRSRKEASAII